MNKESLIILILLVLVVIVIFTFLKKNKDFFSTSSDDELDCGIRKVHNKDTCRNFPFNEDPNCSDQEDIPDIHVNRFNNSKSSVRRDIHYVNPFNPCCLKTCINDFTYLKEHADRGDKAIGSFRREIPLDMLFSSRCAQCLLRFEPALNMMKNPDECLEPEE